MKDIQISLKKLISGLKNDLKMEKSWDLTVEEKACSLVRKEYIKNLIERLKDKEDDLVRIIGD